MQSSTKVRNAAHSHGARGATSGNIGSWKLEEWIGEGCWTRVYRARPNDACDHADYALKILKPEYRNDMLAVQMLQQEAMVGRAVTHPHLISILSAHTDGPPFYVVTPFLEGATLGETLVHRRRLTTPYALWLVRQTAEALEALHQNGWLHTDIKPDNIRVGVNGHATIFDLGLARRIDASRSDREMLAGTPSYLPPEAFCRNVSMTAASDVYSLGVTLYELVTGTLPFPHSDPAELAEALLSEAPPDPRRIVPHLPRRVARVLRHMLAKDPLRRPDGADLIKWLVDLEIDTFDELNFEC